VEESLQSKQARIILQDWMRVRAGEQVLIVTDELHLNEAENIRRACGELAATGVVVSVDSKIAMQGRMGKIVDGAAAKANVIIGATHISIATTTVKGIGEANGARMVSLPMAVNDNISILEADFISQDIRAAAADAQKLGRYFAEAKSIRVTTEIGTDLTFDITGRPVFKMDDVGEPGSFVSASFELCVAPVEPNTNGTAILDGSMGYLGLVEQPVKLIIRNGEIADIEANASGRKLAEYIRDFADPMMFRVAEFGIGLNRKAKCAGRSYVEDESAYGTFHIGFGRNAAIGGSQDTVSHFDLVFRQPDIWVDDRVVMRGGEICVD